MTLQQRCERIAGDLEFLSVEFIHAGFTGAAVRLLEMRQSLRGESCYGDDETPLDVASLLAEAEGGVQ